MNDSPTNNFPTVILLGAAEALVSRLVVLFALLELRVSKACVESQRGGVHIVVAVFLRRAPLVIGI